MSSSTPCKTPAHKPRWVVRTRKANYSRFNGSRWTPSDYSEVVCPECRGRWRTKAAYVDDLTDEQDQLEAST